MALRYLSVRKFITILNCLIGSFHIGSLMRIAVAGCAAAVRLLSRVFPVQAGQLLFRTEKAIKVNPRIIDSFQFR